METVLELAKRLVAEYEQGEAKAKARGHRILGEGLTDEVRLAQEVLRLTAGK